MPCGWCAPAAGRLARDGFAVAINDAAGAAQADALVAELKAAGASTIAVQSVLVNNAGADAGWVNGQILRANGGLA
ncbi:hypothetical protein [Cupriavidus basilensis]|uniref:hypothetical protein n=1 Tax=Cupriavidus basilensis TaxID=68895 RepID=UPI0035A36123